MQDVPLPALHPNTYLLAFARRQCLMQSELGCADGCKIKLLLLLLPLQHASIGRHGVA
jgi:hypothetical protein